MKVQLGILAAAVLLCSAFTTAAAEYKSYDGYQVWRVVPRNEEHLHFLVDLERRAEGVYDFWKEPVGVGYSVDIMIPMRHLSVAKHDLLTGGLSYDVMIDDVGQLDWKVNAENVKAKAGKAFDLYSYNSHREINNYIEELAATYPHIASVETIGGSYEGRSMKLIKLSGTSSIRSESKPIIWIDAGIHAREWLSPATVLYILTQLVQGYSTDVEIRSFIDEIDWYILPSHNPDGYEYSRTDDRMWRKTRSPNPGNPCVGTDPNRNWDFHWMAGGASQRPCMETYAGSKPFSEVETKTVAEYLMRLNINGQVKVFLTVHTYSQMWLHPWGYTTTLPVDHEDLAALGNRATAALTAVHGTTYVVGSSAVVLSVGAGGSDDWAKGVAGVKYSYTIELRDKGRYGFIAPPSEIKPCGEETFEAFKVVARDTMNGIL